MSPNLSSGFWPHCLPHALTHSSNKYHFEHLLLLSDSLDAKTTEMNNVPSLGARKGFGRHEEEGSSSLAAELSYTPP